MSKISSKKRYQQLTSWLDTFKKPLAEKTLKKPSRINYYKSKNG